MRLVLLGVKVLALPDVSRQVAEHGGEVMVAAPAGGGRLPKLAAAHDATESLACGLLQTERGAAPKRDAVIFVQATT